jgi:phospholipase C
VYVSSRNGDLLAFASAGCGAATCAPVWTAHTGGPISAAPTVGANRVFVGSTDGSFYAFNAAGGGEAWHRYLGAAITEAAALGKNAQSEPILYVGTRGDKVFALKSSTGATRWSTDVGGDVSAPPAAAYDLIYVATADGALSALRSWGCPNPCVPAWSRSIGAEPVGPPFAANGLVYAASEDGELQAFNGRRGNRVWDVSLGGPTTAAPVVVNGTVVVGTDDGTLDVFRLPSPPQPPARPVAADLEVPTTPIRHVVVIFQENQSFDSVLGSLCSTDRVNGHPRCDGATTGKLPTNVTIPLAPGTKIVPPVGHSAFDQNLAINNGKMNRFSEIRGCGKDSGYACYQQYSPEQIPNLAALARNYVVHDRTFESEAGPSWGSHFILASGNLDGFVNGNPAENPDVPGPLTWGCDSNNLIQWVPPGGGSKIIVPSCVPKPDGSGPFRPSPVEWVPTIMDRLDESARTWRLYSVYNWWSVCPTFADCLYDPQANNSLPSARVVTDAKQAALPSLSLVMPSWANSQHNGSPMAQGDNWIASIVDAIMQSPAWESTAIFITYDDCGCFYDHVVPPTKGMGIRVPMVIVSPYAKRACTDSTTAVFESMLAYTEHQFGLDPLGDVDANAYNFQDSFDYSQEPLPPIHLQQHPLPQWVERWMERTPRSRTGPDSGFVSRRVPPPR